MILRCALFLLLMLVPVAARAEMIDQPVVKLQSLDKVTARTMTFEVRVGSTVKFGPIYIKVQSCRKAPPIDQPESAAFLQIWEVTPRQESKWIYSGWMFASSPALSAMDHPIYDVWVLDCLERKSTDPVPVAIKDDEFEAPDNVELDNGEVTGADAEPPATPGDEPTVELPTVTLPGEDE